MKLIVQCTAALLLNLLLGSGVQASCSVVKISYAEKWYPLSYDEGEKKAQGIALALHKRVFSELGHDVSFMGGIPWRRQLEMVQSGEIDALATVNFNKERARLFSLSDSIHHYDVRVFIKPDHPIEFKTLKDLTAYRGAYPKGASYGNQFDQFARKTELLQGLTDNEKMMELLFADRLDYVIMPQHLGQYVIRQMGHSGDIAPTGPVLHRQDVHLAISRNSPCVGLIGDYNSVLKKLKKGGELKNLGPHLN